MGKIEKENIDRKIIREHLDDSDTEYFDHDDAWNIINCNQASSFESLRKQAKLNGLNDMSLEDINAEISSARKDAKQ